MMTSPTVKQDITINKRHSRLKAKDEAKSNLRMHFLPCRVDCEAVDDDSGCGSARVSAYFDPVIRDTHNTVPVHGDRVPLYGATFRGRMLRGVELQVPKGYQGLILREEKGSSDTVEGREFEVKGHFEKFHYWNLQTPPTSDDKLLQALRWTQLAKKLHSPLPVKPDTMDTSEISTVCAMDEST